MSDVNYKLTIANKTAAGLLEMLKQISANPVYIGHTNRVTCYACYITSEDLFAITLRFKDVKVNKI